MEWAFGKITDLSDEEYERVYASLTKSRRAHIDRIKPPDARRRSLLGEHLIKTLLLKKGIDAVIERAQNGKPYLKDSQFFISISHCEEAVVVAVSQEPVGIDIERLKPVSVPLIKRACTKEEAEHILSYENPLERSKCFFYIWTAKEAFFKKSQENLKEFISVNTLGFEKETFKKEDFIITIV